MAEPKRKSLFAQRMEKRKENSRINSECTSNPKQRKKIFGEKSCILSGEEATSIHNENVTKLLSMSEEEIIQERNKLLGEIDPSIVTFLQNRRLKMKEPNSDHLSSARTLVEENNKIRDIPESNKNKVGEVEKLVNKFPHMDVVEDEKLKWIGDLPKEVKIPDNPYPARFNFDGLLLPYSDKGEGILQGLHNHGDEQERPGYTIQELIQLSRSSVLQQRVIAINTLAKIMANANCYDECFDMPLIPTLLEADTFLLLRFSLDDSALPVVAAAASALCNLMVNHLDELCLDIMLGTPLGLQQPSFGIALDITKEEVGELKDRELLNLDIVKGALRTDVLTRIKYVLNDLQTEPVEVKHLLKTIIRIARHSYETAEMVVNCPGLLTKVRSLLDKGNEGSFFPEALKLFRILSARSVTLASIIIRDYKILESIFNFITGDKAQNHPETMQLTIESFYLWQTLLHYNLAIDTVGQLTPVLFRLLDAHYGLTDLNGATSDLEHGTALLSTFNCIIKTKPSIIMQAIPSLLNITRKWLTQYMQGMAITLHSSKLVGTSLHVFVHSVSEYNATGELFPILENILNKTCFTLAVQRLRIHSWLIKGKIVSCPENLPCLGSVPQTVQEESSLPFVFAIVSYLLVTKEIKLIDALVTNNEVVGYIEDILNGQNVRLLCGHWYARQETYLLTHLVHLYTLTEIKENENIYQRLAFTLLTSIQSGDKFLLTHLISKTIFNSKFFRPDVEVINLKMQKLQIESNNGFDKHQLLSTALENIGSIESTYIGELGLVGVDVPVSLVTLTGLLNSTQCALPTDWIFLPILRQYNNGSSGNESLQIITRCLQWFIILEEFLPDLTTTLNVTAKYCRLCCVYLLGSDLFRDVTPLLELAWHHIVKYDSQLDFEMDIPGLISFYDFYREVLEQFAFSSYCDRVFGQFVLIPLAQRHNIKFKKLIWSELSAVLRSLSTPISYVNMELYLEPLECDQDLLMTYVRGLATGKLRECWCPVLYRVAVHHVSQYIKERSDDTAKMLFTRINNLGNQELKALLLS